MKEDDAAALQIYSVSQLFFIFTFLLSKVCYIWLHVASVLKLAETAVIAIYVSLISAFYAKTNTGMQQNI